MQHSKSLLYLIVYDTKHIEYLNSHWEYEKHGFRPLYAPAKYSVVFHAGAIDDEILAEITLSTNQHMNDAVWFNCQRDLPHAIKVLQERFPDKPIPDTIDYTIDWPLHRTLLAVPGGTIVTPAQQKPNVADTVD